MYRAPLHVLTTILQSVYQAILDIIRREGVLGLYSGLNSSLLGIAVTNGYVSRNYILLHALTNAVYVEGCTITSTSVLGALFSNLELEARG